MKLIAEITDSLLGLEPVPMKNVQTRHSARGILLDSEGRIAMMNVRRKGFFKLPGGGMKEEDHHSFETTFTREIREETGWTCTEIRPLGMTLEIKSQESKLSFSCAFMAIRQTHVGSNLDAEEEQKGITLEWMDPREAQEILEKQDRNRLEYDPKFIIERDLAILREASKILPLTPNIEPR